MSINFSGLRDGLCKHDISGRQLDVAQASEAINYILNALAYEYRHNPVAVVSELYERYQRMHCLPDDIVNPALRSAAQSTSMELPKDDPA